MKKSHRSIIFTIPTLLSLVTLSLTSCSKDTILVTSTSTGISADGDISAAPDHLSSGFRRRELIYSGKNAHHDASVLATIDSTTSWQKGSSITQSSATGYAADLVASKRKAKKRRANQSNKPLLFVSDTTFGLKAVVIPETAGESPSATLGYKRKLLTRVSSDKNGHLPSTYSHVSVHSASLNGKYISNDSNAGSRLSGEEDLNDTPPKKYGTRIRQSFAIGEAADELLSKEPTEGNLSKLAEKTLVDNPSN